MKDILFTVRVTMPDCFVFTTRVFAQSPEEAHKFAAEDGCQSSIIEVDTLTEILEPAEYAGAKEWGRD